MMDMPSLWIAALAAIAAIGVLRLAWSRPHRSAPLNAAGWGLLILAMSAGGASAGAWGIAVASLWAMGAAAIALAIAAAGSEARPGRAPRRGVGMLPARGEPRLLGRRFATFALVVIGGFASSVACAIGVRALAILAGLSEADANATALFVVPIAWGILATIMLMQERRTAQVASLASCSTIVVLAAFVQGA